MNFVGRLQNTGITAASLAALLAMHASVACATIVNFSASDGYTAGSSLINAPTGGSVKWGGSTDASNTFFVRADGAEQFASTVAGKHNIYASYHAATSDMGIPAGQSLSTSTIKYSFDVRINGPLESEVNFSALTSLRPRLGVSD